MSLELATTLVCTKREKTLQLRLGFVRQGLSRCYLFWTGRKRYYSLCSIRVGWLNRLTVRSMKENPIFLIGWIKHHNVSNYLTLRLSSTDSNTNRLITFIFSLTAFIFLLYNTWNSMLADDSHEIPCLIWASTRQNLSLGFPTKRGFVIRHNVKLLQVKFQFSS